METQNFLKNIVIHVENNIKHHLRSLNVKRATHTKKSAINGFAKMPHKSLRSKPTQGGTFVKPADGRNPKNKKCTQKQ
jgi:hypothetical protein